MHGRPRAPKGTGAADPVKEAEAQKKALLYGQLQAAVLASHREKRYEVEDVRRSARLLEANPDIYSVWTYRKLALQHAMGIPLGPGPAVARRAGDPLVQFVGLSPRPGGAGTRSEEDERCQEGLATSEVPDDEGGAQAPPKGNTATVGGQGQVAHHKELVSAELKLTVSALKGNPKAYGAWYHRKWVVALGAPRGLIDIEREFELLRMLLLQDPRNFHGWNYRRFLVRMAASNRTAEELQFTKTKINENFSNYSAWHERSSLLSLQYGSQLIPTRQLDEEYELVRQAFFTEPSDQSGWLYYTWLLAKTLAHQQADDPNFRTEACHLDRDPEEPETSEPESPLIWDGCEQGSACISAAEEADAHVRGMRETRGGADWLELERPSEGRSFETSKSKRLEAPATAGGRGKLSPAPIRAVPGGPPAPSADAGNGGRGEWQAQALSREIASCRELLELEPDSKWAFIMLSRLLAAEESLLGSSRHIAELARIFDTLLEIDPPHCGYYKDLQANLVR